MHIIIGFLTALGTLLYIFERLGIDLGWLNPWAWKRRRAWRKLSTGNPVYNLDEPIDVVALLATAAAKIDGDLSIEEKKELKLIFQSTFNQSEKVASQLLSSTVYLLGSGEDVFRFPEKVLDRSLGKFSEEQKSLSTQLISDIINIGSKPSDLQQDFFDRLVPILNPSASKSNW